MDVERRTEAGRGAGKPGKKPAWKHLPVFCVALAFLALALFKVEGALFGAPDQAHAEAAVAPRQPLPPKVVESLRFLSEKAALRENRVKEFMPLADPGAVLAGTYGWRTNPVTGEGREFHNGLDIAAPKGTPVLAWNDGVVLETLNDPYMGLALKIAHPGSLTTIYAHLDKILSKTGDIVNRGDIVGTVGYSGRATGPHLHYGVEKDGAAVDPLPYVWGRAAAPLAKN